MIIGCGIAGSAVALFLKRAGISAEIYEARSKTAEDTGFFLNVAPNGMNVLKTLGVAERPEQDGFAATGITFLNHSKKQIGALDNRQDGECYGIRGLVVKRAELHHVLRGELEQQGVPTLFDKKLSGVETSKQGIRTSRVGFVASFLF